MQDREDGSRVDSFGPRGRGGTVQLRAVRVAFGELGRAVQPSDVASWNVSRTKRRRGRRRQGCGEGSSRYQSGVGEGEGVSDHFPERVTAKGIGPEEKEEGMELEGVREETREQVRILYRCRARETLRPCLSA